MPIRSPHDTLITIFGGSGFVGRHVVRALARRNFRIRNAVRRPDLAGHLQPLGRAGQIHSVQANLRYPESVTAAARGSAVVINLVGVLFERGAQSFEAVHTQGAAAVARTAAAADARLIHMSALGADPESPSLYARTKAAGETAVREIVPDATIFRPSVVFGPEDDFFNRFAALARFTPALPLVGGGNTRFQPVYVGDVAEAIARAVEREQYDGTYEIGGPEIVTLKEAMQYVLDVTRRKRLLLPLPFRLAEIKASVLQFMPKPLLTPDQVALLRQDNVVSEAAIRENRTLAALEIEPTSMRAIVPSYLWRFRRHGQFRNRPA
jgi:uncharacterized protein YbjT (DUF2867 family)